MKVISYLKLPVTFDILRLKEETSRVSELPWQEHFQSRHYEGSWTAIPLRSIGGENSIHIAVSNDQQYADTPFLNREGYFGDVLNWFECPLMAVRLLKLAAGSKILEHRDAGLNFENGEARFHIPVTTHPDVEFFLDGERVTMNEGECWYANFNLPHSIDNRSETDRIHLVIDVMVNDWVRDLFSTEGIIRKEREEYDESTTRQIIANLRAMNTESSNRLANEMELTLTPQPTS